ncbi:MAG: exosortase/archaeosortase family protein [Bacteroidota bacterium]
MANLLYNNSVWALKHLTTYEFTTDNALKTIYIGKGYVSVNHGCSGFKQFLQWIVLMVFFPGPWKHKLWFIPAGLVVVHLVNVFRISSLSIILEYNQSQSFWDFSHDWILRPFFYVVMFGMWVIWVEKLVDKKA